MSKKNYKQLKEELDEILEKLDSDSLDIDTAVDYYEKAKILISETEKYLAATKAKIKKIEKS